MKVRARAERGLGAVVAAGFGALAWVVAQALTDHVLAHQHVVGRQRIQHIHGQVIPLVLGSGAVITVSLIALALMPVPTTARARERRRWAVGAAVPSCTFAMLEAATAIHAGGGAGTRLESLALGFLVQVTAGAAATVATVRCVGLARREPWMPLFAQPGRRSRPPLRPGIAFLLSSRCPPAVSHLRGPPQLTVP